MAKSWQTHLVDLQRQLDEMFDELIYRRWPGSSARPWRPALDLHEMPDSYLVAIDLPDVPPDQVEISVHEHGLTIAGQRPARIPAAAIVNRCERVSGTFHRAVQFPIAIDPEKVEAECLHGTYRIRLPKKAAAEPSTTTQPEAARYVIRVVVR